VTAASNHTTALSRVADVNRAIGSFPHSVPDIDSVIIGRTYTRLTVRREYHLLNDHAEYRRLAQLAASFSVPLRIAKKSYGTGKTIWVEFERLGIKFEVDLDLTTTAARELAKALGRKLTAEPLTITPAELFAAVDTLEQS
jgi:hypothetical protein